MSNYKGPYNSFSESAEPIYSQGNVVGTVSQSGGVPTGAIIERGSNSDGEYVKYAGGLLICSLNVTNNLDGSLDIIYQGTFPQPFLNNSLVSFSLSLGGTSSVRRNWMYENRVSAYSTNASSWRLTGNGTNTATSNFGMQMIAVGYWHS